MENIGRVFVLLEDRNNIKISGGIYMCGYHYWGMGSGWLLGLIFVVIVIWLVTRAHYHGYYHYQRLNSDSAINILKERYAKGEIGKEEFEEKKKDLLK